MVLSLPSREKRIPANAILTTQHLHAVRPTLREPLVDFLDPYLRQVSGLLGSQHLAIKLADTTVRSRQPLDDPLLLEKSNLDSSSFCCRHGRW